MPRPLISLAVLFAIAIAAAAALLYVADRREVQRAVADRSAVTGEKESSASDGGDAASDSGDGGEVAATEPADQDEAEQAAAADASAAGGGEAAPDASGSADEAQVAPGEAGTGEVETASPAGAGEEGAGQDAAAAAGQSAEPAEQESATTVREGTAAPSETSGELAAAPTQPGGEASNGSAAAGSTDGAPADVAANTAPDESAASSGEEAVAAGEGTEATSPMTAGETSDTATAPTSEDQGSEGVASSESPATGSGDDELAGATVAGEAGQAAPTTADEEAQVALQYPAPLPSFTDPTAADAGSAAATAPGAAQDAASGASTAEGAETPPAATADAPIQMPTSGEMVASPAAGDAVTAEARDVTPEPAISETESEADARSLAERASAGTVEAQDVTIRAAEAEADNLYVAGEAAPGSVVQIYANDELVGEARAGAEGTWLVEAARDVPLGEVVIRADAAAAGAAGPVAQAEAAFTRFPDGVVLEPVGTATSEGGGVAAAGYMPVPTYALIRRGDNLWRIARRNYGRGIRYEAIFEANSDRIRDPDLIYPGQVFVIPKGDVAWEAATN